MPGHFLHIGVPNEQVAVERLKNFLVKTVGWEIAEDVTDAGTDRDVVFSSGGELDVPNGFTRYIRLRGQSNAIQLYTYETFNSIGDNTGELTQATYGKVTTEGDAQGFTLMAVADKERVVIYAETYNQVKYMGYVGRIKSYYNVYQNKYPNLVKGAQATTYDWYYSAAERNAWMIGVDGSIKHYYGIQPFDNTALAASAISLRNGKSTWAAPVLVHNGDATNSELAGEPRGLYRMYSEFAQTGSFFTDDGETYVVFEYDSMRYAVGPIETVTGLSLAG